MTLQLKKNLSQYWHCIQSNLLPWLQEELGTLNDKHRQIVCTLELCRVEEFVSHYQGNKVGRPAACRAGIARAFVAKAVLNLSSTRQLLDRLAVDKVLRRLCGFERVNDIPKEWTFSRAFAEFAKMDIGGLIHKALIKAYQSDRLVGHISRDSTAIEARESPVKKQVSKTSSESEPKRKRGRPKKGESVRAKPKTRIERQLSMQSLNEMLSDLPTDCDVGTKINAKGYKTSWRGYKLHIDTADGGIPVSAILTSASLHDSQVAIPLAKMSSQRVINLYDLMDSAYDSGLIRLYCYQLGHVPIIDFNKRKKDDRHFKPHEKERYKERSTAERVNARLKDEFGASYVRVRGHAKVMLHLMLGVIALTVDQLLKLAT
jgi:hypothetical protein